MDFEYTDPTPNFDRNKVKGLVANLITLSGDNYSKSTALEIAAGGRLYNVVVDDERVGSQLLDGGRLKKRVTLIPLNKIKAFTASAQVCYLALKSLEIFTLILRNLQPHLASATERRSSHFNSLDMKKKFPMLWRMFLATF